MNRESIFLRGLDNLLEDNTIVAFAVVLTFLLLVNYLFNRLKKVITNKWLASFFAAWISTVLVMIIYGAIKLSIFFVSTARFGGVNSVEGIPRLLLWGLFASALSSIIYLVYYWVKEKCTSQIKNPIRRGLSEAVAMLVVACTAWVAIQFTGNTVSGFNYNLDRAFRSLAIASSPIFGTCLAIFAYSYGSYLNTFKIQQKELQISRLQQQVAQSQLDALSSKINPHFLYNSLNSIAGLAMEDGLKTRNMAIALSKLFRYNINREENNHATVSEELEMVSLYLEIEKIRFEERLQYTSKIQPGLENDLIPMHLLQPLVENAVKHGAGPNGIVISISIKKSGKDILLSVFDEGKAFDTDLKPGYGLKSLYDKLDILAGRYEIAFLNEPKEVRITISDLKTKV